MKAKLLLAAMATAVLAANAQGTPGAPENCRREETFGVATPDDYLAPTIPAYRWTEHVSGVLND